MKELDYRFNDERKEYFNLKKELLRYWGYKKYFILSGIFCLLLAVGYILTAVPSYNVTASITIHDEERGGSKNDIFSAERLFYQGRDWLNTENEIEVLKSTSLLEQVVVNLGLYTTYRQKGILHPIHFTGTRP